MHFGQLALFHAVAETGSVTRAAERAMVSQPAVSKQIRQLERALGAALFERVPRGVRLTDAGRVLAGYSARLFALADEAERAVRDESFVDRGRVSVGASPTIGTYVLPDVLVHMRRRFPAIEVRVETAAPRRLAAAIDDGELDVAVTSVPLATRRADRREFAKESLVLIAAHGDAVARRGRPLSPQRLGESPFITHPADDPARAFEEATLAARGVAMRVALTLASTEAIKRAVAGGLGVALVPRVAVADEVRRRTLAIVRLAGPPVERPIYVTSPAGRREPKAATAFLCLLKHGLRGTLPALPSAGVRSARR